MPRPKSDIHAKLRQAERQARYRIRLADRRRPEEVDVVIAEAVALIFRAIDRETREHNAVPDDPAAKVLKRIIRDARKALVVRGYDEVQSADKLLHRMRRDAWKESIDLPSQGDAA